MCLVALALAQSRRFPLVLASNRDEYFDRDSAPLDWWASDAGAAPILGGRDLRAGGTWLGLGPGGRIGLVTNVRDASRQDNGARSRGELVPAWLASDLPLADFWPLIASERYNGFNLVAADARGDWFWASNATASPRRLAAGVHGISNAPLDIAWPKVTRLKARLQVAVADAAQNCSVHALVERLFAALADRSVATDGELPSTGISLELERVLSAAFIHTPDGRYGTRCSTVVVRECDGARHELHVIERSFGADGRTALQRRFTLAPFPAGGERKL